MEKEKKEAEKKDELTPERLIADNVAIKAENERLNEELGKMRENMAKYYSYLMGSNYASQGAPGRRLIEELEDQATAKEEEKRKAGIIKEATDATNAFLEDLRKTKDQKKKG